MLECSVLQLKLSQDFSIHRWTHSKRRAIQLQAKEHASTLISIIMTMIIVCVLIPSTRCSSYTIRRKEKVHLKNYDVENCFILLYKRFLSISFSSSALFPTWEAERTTQGQLNKRQSVSWWFLWAEQHEIAVRFILDCGLNFESFRAKNRFR